MDFFLEKGIIVTRGRTVRRSKTQTRAKRHAISTSTTTLSTTTTTTINKTRRPRHPKSPPSICPREYHLNRSAQVTWIFERGGMRQLQPGEDDVYNQDHGRPFWFTQPEEPIRVQAGLSASLNALYSLAKRAVTRMFGK
ncbi:hypothetical protein CDV31_003500 [Fusarium ambrosium]|uniref:Uncharacterized protein n=1 Tax=Fusarium ambrosium TaxID=131363 RepID=A0A428UTY9_9HYPO|nr:hypothetical protein CDV31_003500 [Fusarium ambrosium]